MFESAISNSHWKRRWSEAGKTCLQGHKCGLYGQNDFELQKKKGDSVRPFDYWVVSKTTNRKTEAVWLAAMEKPTKKINSNANLAKKMEEKNLAQMLIVVGRNCNISQSHVCFYLVVCYPKLWQAMASERQKPSPF